MLRPSNKRRFAEATTEGKTEILASALRQTQIVAIALTVSLAATIVYLVLRREESDQKTRDLACLALQFTPPDSPFHVSLRKRYPYCPNYREPKRPKASTSTHSVTVTTTPSARARGAGPASPSPTPSESPVRPRTGKTEGAAKRDGSSVASTRVRPTTSTRVITRTRPAPSPSPTASRPVGLLPNVLCPVATPLPLIGGIVRALSC